MPRLMPRSSILWQCFMRSSLSLAMPSAEHRAMTDGVVGSSQIDVGNTGTGVGGVDDGLAVGAVVDLDTGLDSPLVGGVQCQRNIVEVLLQQLDSPHHALGTVLLGRSDVDVQIGGAGSDLLGSTLQDGLGVTLVHSLADRRAQMQWMRSPMVTKVWDSGL